MGFGGSPQADRRLSLLFLWRSSDDGDDRLCLYRSPFQSCQTGLNLSQPIVNSLESIGKGSPRTIGGIEGFRAPGAFLGIGIAV